MGKRVLITGATSGIGSALAHYYAGHADLLLAGRRPEMDIRQDVPADAGYVAADQSRPEEAATRIGEACESLGWDGLDLAILNAGTGYVGDPALEDPDRLRETLDRDMPGQFEFFDEDRLVSSLSIEDNLLFGRPRLDRPKARQSIERFIGEIVDQTGLRDVIMRAGLAFEVGVAGSRLSTGQKQRVALVRMVLRRPAVVFADGLISGTGSNDPVLSFLKETLPDSAIICGMARSDMAGSFDHVIVMREGHLVAEGTPDAVADALSPLRVAAE